MLKSAFSSGISSAILLTLGFLLIAPTWPAAASPNPNDLPPKHFIMPRPREINSTALSGSRRGGSPLLLARSLQAGADYDDGVAAIRAKNYVSAENSFEASLSNKPDGSTYLGLAQTLAAQGKTAEALQAYWQIFHPDARHSWGGTYYPQAELEYAVLLSQNGRWAEAVAMYEKALPEVSDQGMSKINAHFDPAVPQPTELQAAAHVGIGLEAIWAGSGFDASRSERAFQEFTKAMQLEPNWPAANYYYGYGWQRLSPAERANLAAKPGQREAVKAALETAAKLGTGDVSAEAKAELQHLR